MKLREGFILQEVAGESVIVPSGESLDMNVMVTLNSTACFLWKLLEEETTEEALVEALLGEYGIDRGTAQACVADFVKKLAENEFLA